MSHDLLQSIFSLDTRIRYAAILTQRGDRIEGGMRPGVQSLNPEEEEQKMFTQSAISKGMSESWIRYFDRWQFLVIGHAKLKMFEFPYQNNILFVTAEPSISLEVVEKILNLLES